MHRQQDDGQDEHAAGGGAKILCQMANGLLMPSARPQRLAAQRTARSLRAAITWSAMMDSTLNPSPAGILDGQRALGSGGSSSRRHFVERERKTRRAIATGERDKFAQT